MRAKLLIITLLGYIFAFIGCTRQEIKNIDSKGKNIICFGDSITFGYGVQPGQDYPSQLAKMLNYPVINAGVDGDTTLEGLKRIKNDCLDRDPLLVIIEFGGNDFLRKIPLEETIGNLSQMIDLIQQKGAMVALADISAGLILSEYRRAYLQLAKKKKAIFIPGILKGILTDPQLKSDFLHPNALGYQIIAQKVYRAILPYLNKNSLLNR